MPVESHSEVDAPAVTVDDLWPTVLPTLQTSETLYSWCGTYHRWSSGVSATGTSQRLFGHRYAALLHDFPAHLSTFCLRTRGCLGSTDDIARRHTLLGYFLPFVSVQSAHGILAGVTDRATPDLKMRLGIPASGVGAYHPLRCCRECIREDESTIGWPAWHIEHQVPSALVCVRHARPLIQTWDRISPVHRREWEIPSQVPSAGRLEFSIVGDAALCTLLELASASKLLFELHNGVLSHGRLNEFYREWANQHGCLTAGGSLRHAEFAKIIGSKFRLIQQAFGSIGPASCQLNLESIAGTVVRASYRAHHPLKHLAMIVAMSEEPSTTLLRIASLVEERSEEPTAHHHAFGKRRRTPQASTESKKVFDKLLSQGVSITAAAAGACVSTTTGLSWARKSNLDVQRRPKKLKPEVLRSIVEAILKGTDRKDIAFAAGVSIVTINRLISENAELGGTWKRLRAERTRKRHQSAIRAAVASLPEAGAKQIRRRAGSSWIWLYRHDKEWLMNVLPNPWAPKNAEAN